VHRARTDGDDDEDEEEEERTRRLIASARDDF